MATGFRLAVDFGTSHTVAALQGPEGIPRPLAVDGPGLMPSAVLALPGGEILVAGDAIQRASTYLTNYEPYPKRQFGANTIYLGDGEVSIEELVAAVLRRILEEAERAAGGRLSDIVLTHPAGWASGRRDKLRRAAKMAGMHRVRLVSEPTAALNFFVKNGKIDSPPGGITVVYDFGAGTFDCSIVRHTKDGFEVVADSGIEVGGLDVDESVIQYLARLYRNNPQWEALVHPSTTDEFRALQQLRANVRSAKEALSRHAQTTLHIPMLNIEALITRETLEDLARPTVASTIEALQSTIQELQLRVKDVTHIVLVGGASRMPLVASMLHRELGIRPTVLEQPELVVALGALQAEELPSAVPPTIASPPAKKATPRNVASKSKTRPRRRWVPWVAACSVVAIIATVAAWQMDWYGLVKLPNWVSLKGHTQPASMVKFSADGRYAASIAPDHRVIKWDAETGEILWSHDYPDDASLDDIALSADGAWVAVNISNDATTRGVAILEGSTGAHNRFLTTDQSLVMAMCGDRVAFTVGNELKLVAIGNWDKIETITIDGPSINWFACNSAGTQVTATLGATLIGFDIVNDRKLWEQPLESTGYITHEYIAASNSIAVLTELGLVVRNSTTGDEEQELSFGRVGLTGATTMSIATIHHDGMDIIALADLGTLRFMSSNALNADVAEPIKYNESYAATALTFRPGGRQIGLDISPKSDTSTMNAGSLSIRRVDYF